MPDALVSQAPRGLGYLHVARNWGWFAALGLGMIAAGLFALDRTVLVTLISVTFIGGAMIAGGVFQLLHAFATKGWGAFALNVAAGLLYIAGGLLAWNEPLQGSLVITILLTVMLVLNGTTRIAMGLSHREMPSWWTMVLGGAVALLAGILLYASLPWSGLFLLGTIVGFELVFQGITWLFLGISLRRLTRPHHQP
jgi:uncharacterized membrane protein HdeD (DUF308 family)